MKKILFLAHSNNEIDHFLPLAAALQESKRLEPIILFLRLKEEIQLNKSHAGIIDSYGIRNITLLEINSVPHVTRLLLSILKYTARESSMIPLRALLKEFRAYKFFLKFVYLCIESMFRRYTQYLLPGKSLKKFIDINAISMLVIDTQYLSKHGPFDDFRSYAASKIVEYCKKSNIPLFMVPHGGATVLKLAKKEDCKYFHFDPSGVYNPKDYFCSDILGLNTEQERDMLAAMIEEKTKVFVLGTLRYDYAWEKKIQKFSLNVPGSCMQKNGFVILYIVAPLGADIESKCHRDIIELMNFFPQAELWIKNHPRYPWQFTLNDSISAKIKIFRNETDTSILIHYSDLVISPLSSTLLQAVINKKPVILYDWWRKHINFYGETAFDNTPCILRASNFQELHKFCRQTIEDGATFLNDDNINEFYKTRISAGLDREESIVSRYVEVVEKYSI